MGQGECMTQDRDQGLPGTRRLCALLVPAAAYLMWASYSGPLDGSPLVDGTIGVLLGLFICAHPAANGIDLIFLERGAFRRQTRRWSGVSWLALNGVVLFVGWLVIVAGATEVFARERHLESVAWPGAGPVVRSDVRYAVVGWAFGFGSKAMPTRLSAASNPALSTALAYASSGATSFLVTSSSSASFSATMPTALPTCIIDGIWNVLPSRIRLLIAPVDDQHFERRDAAAADLAAQRLRDHALQRFRQHDPDLRLPIGRELIDDAVDGRRRRRRVQRAEHQVAGLRRLDRDRDGLEVAQLADQDDVRILAQRRAQRVLERVGVRAHLALVDQALLVLVDELDRILDRDDVILARLVDVVDHRAQRRRLARAGRAGDEHQPLVQLAQLQDVRRQAELLGGQDLRRDDAEHRARALAIGEDVRAEPRQAGDLVGEVGVVPRRRTPCGSSPA